MKRYKLTLYLLVVSLLMTQALAQKPKVSVWIEDNDTTQCYIDTLSTYNSDSSMAEVEFVPQANQWDVTRTALAGGSGPDIVVTPGPSFVYELAKAGLLLPMDDYTRGLGWDKDIVSWALSLGSVDGKLYSIPVELETMILYYNKTLFEQNGWSPPKTMDDLMTLAQTIQDAGITPFSGSNSEWRPANEWYASAFFNAVSGPQAVYEALSGTRPWTDATFVDAISALDSLQQNGWISGGLENYYTLTTDEYWNAFGKGEAAMVIEGSWAMGTIANYFGDAAGNSNDWDWVPFPSVSGEETFAIGVGSTYSINASSKVTDAAADYLSFFFSPETQASLTETCGFAPAPVRLTSDMLSGLDSRRARLYETISKASDAGNYGYLTWTFWGPKSDVYIYEEIEKVWGGEMTVEDYLAGLNDIASQELAANETPPLPAR
jgi:raffinose/stachyose/melibiose transport system substrate-binding protein